MPAFSEYPANASEVTTIGGLGSSEGATSLASVNNMLRELAAQGRQLHDIVAAMPAAVPKAGGVIDGDIRRKDFGGYYFSADVNNTTPRIYILPDGSPAPASPPAGSLLIYHVP